MRCTIALSLMRSKLNKGLRVARGDYVLFIFVRSEWRTIGTCVTTSLYDRLSCAAWRLNKT